ncbi:MAG: RagB/SusD family nutrient uptake outer membrane protein, partial [Longimicrobiales bacterium]
FSTSTPQQNHQNWMWYISSNTPYRAYSVWNTFYDSYFTQTGDPRVAWGRSSGTPNSEFSTVPWYFQMKYANATAPMNLSTGREMVLIRAEVALRAGNFQAALDLINSLRSGLRNQAGQPIPLRTAANATEAWTALKRERGIELWLENRRLGDLWRWVDGNTPGDMENVTDRIRLCFPIATSELQTNPNLALDHQSPRNPRYTGTR